jgi:hypothetical protein
MMSTSHHVDVAAYVLGILDKPDDAAFAQHLTRCPQCRAEYRELSDLPVLLDQLKPGPAERTGARLPTVPSEQPLNAALDRISASRRRQRATLWLAAAAAAVVLVTVPLVSLLRGENDGQVAAPNPPASPTTTTTTTDPATTAPTVAGAHSIGGTNPETGLTAQITIQDEPWGTKVNMELRGITGPRQCQLVAVRNDGYSRVVATWTVPPAGFGVPGSQLPLKVGGGVGMAQEDIVRFEVTQEDGPVLLTVAT